MGYWLMKSEPDVWSIDQQKKVGLKGAVWERRVVGASEFKFRI